MADNQDIDALCSKIINESIGDTELNNRPMVQKFKYPLLMDSQIRKLKQSLEGWKAIVLVARDVLLWKLNWHPTAIFAGATAIFTLIWLSQPSILTLVALLGLCFTISDYLIPSINASMMVSDQWTVKKDREFEEICTNIILYKAKAELAWATYYRLKKTNTKLYYVVTLLILSLLAWIGCTVNNLFLSYLAVNLALFTPGIIHHGLMNRETSILQPLRDIAERANLMIGQYLKRD